MKILILNGGPGDGRGRASREIAEAVAGEARAKAWNVEAFELAEMDIKPCRGCFACWLKHPGTCAIKDDEESVLKSVAVSEVQVWITPVTFGGYSPALKKALDRCIPNILPFFTKRQGEIHHPQRYEIRRRILAFGTLSSPDAEAERIFHNLVRRNAINWSSILTESRIFYDGAGEGDIKSQVRELLEAAEEVR